MKDSLLAGVLLAMEVAVIERLSDDRYQILGTAPDWLERAFDEAPAGARHQLGGALPFLDHFYRQADRAWHDRAQAGSGPFAATVGGEELLLRATALTVDGRELLLVERLTGDADTRPILQKAREQVLATEVLVRQASLVHTRTGAIAKIAADLTTVPLEPAARALVDRLNAAVADLAQVAEGLPKPPAKTRRR